MKNKIISMFVGLVSYAMVVAQATLPTSYDFATATLPTGWTSNPATPILYTASGNPFPAMKFQATGNSLTINVAGAPGTMNFDIAGNSFSGAGTFEVQESTDGTTYTTNKVFNSGNLSTDGSYVNQQVTLASATRYIRFIYVNKTAGNVGLDNVTINAGSVTTQQMKVLVNSNPIINGQTVYAGSAVATQTIIPFFIQNAGTVDALTVNSITITGANASDFALNMVMPYPFTVSAGGNQNIGLKFTPSAAGTRTCTVTITSNDLDNPTFTYNVVGYGGNLATEPTAQPTNLTFTNLKSYRMTAGFNASGAEGYLVLRKNGAAVTETPVDGTVYGPGDIIGGAKVVQAGVATSFIPNDIVSNSNYYFAVFAYNGVNQYTNYLTTSPLTGNQTSLTNMIPAGEYSGINTSSSTLIDDLHNLIKGQFQQYYSNYGSTLIEHFYQRDTTNGKKTLTGSYTGINYVFDKPFNFTSAGLSREHTYAYSWMPLTDQNANYYSDYHNLFPVNQNDANAIRSNYPFGIVVSDTIQAHGDSYLGKNAQGQWVFEPRDDQKGAAARAIFYMCTRYTENGTTWALPAIISATINYGQNQDILKQWNNDYPPTKLEIARNDYLDSLQQNRNPFIDHPEYACFIDFSNMTYHAEGCNLSVKNQDLSSELSIYPNPASDFVTISMNNGHINGYKIVDLQGRTVRNVVVLDNATSNDVNVSSLDKGIYMITVTTDLGEISKKLVVR